METNDDQRKQQTKHGSHEHPFSQEISTEQRKQNKEAHNAADKDIENDAELSAHNSNDDLDEGETARLGDNNDLI